MKTKSFFFFFLILWSHVLFTSCTRGPSENEIKNAVVERLGSQSLLLDLSIENRGSSRKTGNDIKVFPVTVKLEYIQGGMGEYGYIPECPEAQCLKDFEYKVEREYLMGKDQWDAWKIFDSRHINGGETQTFWRPTSKSMEEFYKDRIKLK
jgi:hypothetical protein